MSEILCSDHSAQPEHFAGRASRSASVNRVCQIPRRWRLPCPRRSRYPLHHCSRSPGAWSCLTSSPGYSCTLRSRFCVSGRAAPVVWSVLGGTYGAAVGSDGGGNLFLFDGDEVVFADHEYISAPVASVPPRCLLSCGSLEDWLARICLDAEASAAHGGDAPGHVYLRQQRPPPTPRRVTAVAEGGQEGGIGRSGLEE